MSFCTSPATSRASGAELTGWLDIPCQTLTVLCCQKNASQSSLIISAKLCQRTTRSKRHTLLRQSTSKNNERFRRPRNMVLCGLHHCLAIPGSLQGSRRADGRAGGTPHGPPPPAPPPPPLWKPSIRWVEQFEMGRVALSLHVPAITVELLAVMPPPTLRYVDVCRWTDGSYRLEHPHDPLHDSEPT